MRSLPVEEPPGDAGKEEEGGLAEQDERHPLVVGDHLARVLGARHVALKRYVVCIRDPANRVGVLLKQDVTSAHRLTNQWTPGRDVSTSSDQSVDTRT